MRGPLNDLPALRATLCTAVDDESIEPSAEEARRWLLKAKEDLAVAGLVLDSPIGVNWASCFHAQQAAEKALTTTVGTSPSSCSQFGRR